MQPERIAFLTFKILGLAPLSYTSNNSTTFKYSYLGTFYNIFLLVSVISWAIYLRTNQADTVESEVESEKRYTVTGLDYTGIYSLFFAVTVTHIVFSVYQTTLVRVANRLYLIVMELKKLLNVDVSLTKQKWLLGSNCVIYSVMILNDCFAKVNPLMKETCIYVLTIIMSWMVTQYICVVILLQNMLNELNRKFMINCSDSRLFAEKKSFSIMKNKSSWKLERFMSLRNIFLEIVEIAGEISKVYSFPILAWMCKTFFYVVFDAYYIVRPLVFRRDIVTNLQDVSAVLWLLMDMFFLTSATFSITKASREVGSYFLAIDLPWMLLFHTKFKLFFLNVKNCSFEI